MNETAVILMMFVTGYPNSDPNPINSLIKFIYIFSDTIASSLLVE